MTHDLDSTRELILLEEENFARAIAVRAVEKPQVSFWLVLIPILFLYYIYRIKKYKKSLARFIEDFMTTRKRAMELAWDAVVAKEKPHLENAEWLQELSDDLQGPYRAWLIALTDYYVSLLSQEGESFAQLVRSRYRNRSEYLLALNRLSSVEKEFYAVIKPRMQELDGAAEVISTMEKSARILRRELAERIYP